MIKPNCFLMIAMLVSTPAMLRPANAAATPANTVMYQNVMIPMRDGTTLATDIYIPSDDGKTPAAGRFPVLTSRTFYNKAIKLGAPTFATHGYVVVSQDVRGRFASKGAVMPWLNDGWGERQDGYDTAVWLSKQPWSDGRIGIYGSSYLGGSAWGAVLSHPPGLTAAAIDDPASDNYNGMTYINGALGLFTAAGWSFGEVAGSTDLSDEQRKQIAAANEKYADPNSQKTPVCCSGFGWAGLSFFESLPLRDMPVIGTIGWWSGWLDHWEKPDYFDATNTLDRIDQVNVPILHRVGWYSLFLPTTIAQFKGASTRPSDSTVRSSQRLVIGPWGHGTCPKNGGCAKFPDGAAESNSLLDTDTYNLALFDHAFKSTPNPIVDHPVIIYVMGENRWRAEDTWPLAGTVRTSYFLHSAGQANTAKGNGELSTTAPKTEPADHFAYDPHNPVPSRCSPAVLMGGMCIQNAVEDRSDVLVFTTPALGEDLEVTGEWKVNLFASSTAKDTDWFVKLVDVYPDGAAYNLGSGVVRGRYRHSRTKPEPLSPGTIERYEITTWATSNVFKKGHRIRLEVSSSDFPWIDRNPNAYVDLTRATQADFVVAHQAIYHDSRHPSSIDLPVIPNTRQRNWIDAPFLSAGGRQAPTKAIEIPGSDIPK